ncbi:MAG TPA: phosphocholine cytidylyltransferase family protein [Prolixibacteraceae bacterium]|nr:phosphocholine cytidylyltransferase family protein [Prolixibacteraceae bacterium]
MQGLILAAGFGKRLQPLTLTVPKSLIEVNGTPLLINSLNHLSERNITEVLIVIGDKRDIIVDRIGHHYKGMKITYIENPLYEKTNNVYSFWLAKNYIHDDIIMLECDLFYNRPLIDITLNGQADCNILVSKFDEQSMDGTVIEIKPDESVKSLIIKRDQSSGFNYSDKFKTVNVYFFKKNFIVNQFMPAIETYINTQSVNSYYELVLGSLIYFGNCDIKAVKIDQSQWCEIDDIHDLKRAESKFS